MENEIAKIHAGGRPSKYTPEVLRRAKWYRENYEEVGDAIPSLKGLACFLHIGKTTIYRWKYDPEKWQFRDTLEKISLTQGNRSIEQRAFGRIQHEHRKACPGKFWIPEETKRPSFRRNENN